MGIFPPEDVKEVEVIAGAMDAEYGRTVGGIINMVTRGGNTTDGEFLLLERRPGLIANPSLVQGSKRFQQWAVFSLNLGGLMIKDKVVIWPDRYLSLGHHTRFPDSYRPSSR